MNEHQNQMYKKLQNQSSTAPKREANNQNILQNGEQDQMNYYNQYCRLYIANAVLSTQLKQLNAEKTELQGKLFKLQKKGQQISEGNSGTDQKKKRIRRSACEIARHYPCPIEGCSKSYGSQGSLNQHIKLKHPDLYRTMNDGLTSKHQNEVKEQVSNQQDQS